ncbi:SRPBCC domain-containing protein [Pontibacter sp. JH31]|uniref:SRPBCC domain-containing protein n=1 Tax=Pontibacter aquaedesilientis TaxID=2766980 RepID=A0ABR7XKR0_9BACT|nr:SRPBCC domain-containing protein [Pontibacter aquaedesilientis]MBD1398879.1 SRPBCC domain-containing protein [Pontibacter aquaedesilientis]
MKHIQTEILIAAKPEKVWTVLTDFEKYATWNPFIKSIAGEKAVGKRLKTFIQPPDGSGMTFKPVVLNYDTNKEFRWKGKLGTSGIFDGEHYFRLVYMGENTTKFIHGEKFSGLLVPLMGGVLSKTEKGFQLMNEALKRECEKV